MIRRDVQHFEDFSKSTLTFFVNFCSGGFHSGKLRCLSLFAGSNKIHLRLLFWFPIGDKVLFLRKKIGANLKCSKNAFKFLERPFFEGQINIEVLLWPGNSEKLVYFSFLKTQTTRWRHNSSKCTSPGQSSWTNPKNFLKYLVIHSFIISVTLNCYFKPESLFWKQIYQKNTEVQACLEL